MYSEQVSMIQHSNTTRASVDLSSTGLSSVMHYLGLIALVIGVVFQLLPFISDKLLDKISKTVWYYACRTAAWYKATAIVVQDFRNRKYYKPWKSSNITVVSTKHVKELSEASELSQRAVYADMFGFKHTMNGIEHNRTAIVRSRLYGRLLQVNGPRNLAVIFSSLKSRLDGAIDKQLAAGQKNKSDWVSVPLTSTIKTITSDLMSAIFFGEELSSNKQFTAALLQYPKDMISSMMAFQITPSFLSSTIHNIVTKRGQAMHFIQDLVASEIQTSKDQAGGPFTILRNMVELVEDSDYWTSEIMAQSLLGIWFAAAHQPWMNLDFVILELCARQESIERLRDEVGDFNDPDYTYEKLERLPFLDSFIKETIRLNPLDNLAIRRKALQPFKFTDGPVVPVGSVTCISSYDAMHNTAVYPKPDFFDGERFMAGTKLTEVSENFPVWGFGSLACPGRFHASLVMKMWVAYFVTNFDFKFEDENKPVRWMWETFTMPYQSTRVLIRKRG